MRMLPNARWTMGLASERLASAPMQHGCSHTRLPAACSLNALNTVRGAGLADWGRRLQHGTPWLRGLPCLSGPHGDRLRADEQPVPLCPPVAVPACCCCHCSHHCSSSFPHDLLRSLPPSCPPSCTTYPHNFPPLAQLSFSLSPLSTLSNTFPPDTTAPALARTPRPFHDTIPFSTDAGECLMGLGFVRTRD